MSVAAEPISHTFEEASAVSAFSLVDGDSTIDGIPTIELSSSAGDFQVQSIEISTAHDDDHREILEATTAITVAELVADTVRDADLEAGGKVRIPSCHFGPRAEFVSATFIKATAETPLGFNLYKNDTKIASITEGSLASYSPLQVDDRIYSINKKQCSGMSSSAVAKYLANLAGRVTVVVHNKGGDASMVESMVTKDHPRDKSGLVLKRVGQGQLMVSNIRDDKVFIDSLLNIGDEVLTINGISCLHLSPIEAANIIKQTPKDVTVVARSLLETGVVVAELTSRDMLTSCVNHANSPARLQQDLDRRRRGISPAERQLSKERAMCSLFAVIGMMVAVSFFVASRFNDGEDYYHEPDELGLDGVYLNSTGTGSGCDFWGSDCNDLP